ncbi:hypothetical protein GQ600_10304 [Phytophthora cactorum]|nr:hypothetical protein GQ600_10304 [Phytophthora cactorum]
MEEHDARDGMKTDRQAARCRISELRVIDGQDTITSTVDKAPRQWMQVGDLLELPWTRWAFICAYVLFIFSSSRCAMLKALITMYGSPDDYTFRMKTAVITLGFLEDVACTTYFVCALWLFDMFKRSIIRKIERKNGVSMANTGDFATFTGSWFYFFLLVLNREMRFTFDVLAAMIRERDHLSKAPLEFEEAHWTDLTRWNPTHLLLAHTSSRQRTVKQNDKDTVRLVKYEEIALEDGMDTNNTKGKWQQTAFSSKRTVQ